MFVTLYKTGEVPFCLFGTNGFHVKAENEKFIAVGLRCFIFHAVIWQTASKIAPKSVPHVQHDYFSSFNQSNH